METQPNCKASNLSSSFKSLKRLPNRSGSGFSLLSRGSKDASAVKDTPSRRFVPRRQSKDTIASSMNTEKLQRRAERKKLQQALQKLHSESSRELSHDEVMKMMSTELARSTFSKQTASITDDDSGHDAHSVEAGPSYMERWFPKMACPITVEDQSKEAGSVDVSTLDVAASADIDDDDDEDVAPEYHRGSPFKPPLYIEFVIPQMIEL